MRRRRLQLALLSTALIVASCGPKRPPLPPSAGGGVPFVERGVASWYGPGFDGRRTANGEVYDMEAMTAAHKELPFGTVVEVVNLDNGRRTTVRINDRGPFVRGRIIDLSKRAARAIDMLGPGIARVEIRATVDTPTVGGAPYTVQVGAFRRREHAAAVVDRLRPRFDARIERRGEWYRVRVGGTRDRAAARRLARELRQAGFDAVVVGV